MDIKDLFNLSGRVAVVTGGVGFYGTPLSEALAEAGAHVIIASRRRERCDAWAAELVKRGLRASGETYDQGNEESILAFTERVWKEFGAIDILVNNSVAREMFRYEDPLEKWRKSLEVNGAGLFAISRAFVDRMMARGKGSVINISSIQGVVAPDFSNYAGTSMTTPPDYQFHKHGLIGLTKYLAAWGGPRGVRCNAISPGGFQTPEMNPLFLKQYCRRVFLGRLALHDDIKGAVVFLASDAAAYVTGQNIAVDGGYTV
jgi:NAD(P)-dependent dehydrogenase (short-subunit alcohol dehydrogenase family)